MSFVNMPPPHRRDWGTEGCRSCEQFALGFSTRRRWGSSDLRDVDESWGLLPGWRGGPQPDGETQGWGVFVA